MTMNVREHVGLEKGLAELNREIIAVKDYEKKKIVIAIVKEILLRMCKTNPIFEELYVKFFQAGSCYEGLKIRNCDECDFNILLKLHPSLEVEVLPSDRAGFVHLVLHGFRRLNAVRHDLYKVMKNFVQAQKFLLCTEFRQKLFYSTFDKTVFDSKMFIIDGNTYEILRDSTPGPAKTMVIQGPGDFLVSVDLVPCLAFGPKQWPKNFRENPCSKSKRVFFAIPKTPNFPNMQKKKNEYFRLSFQVQEQAVILNRQFLKPTIRLLKLVRDKFAPAVSSYAIKTMFLQELERGNTDKVKLDATPILWYCPLSFCFVFMLKTFMVALIDGKIRYFWQSKLNLIEDLTPGQRIAYKDNIHKFLTTIMEDPSYENILRALEQE